MDLREWAVSLIEKDNRKSHLAPQLSPSTQQLLRSADSPTSVPYTNSPDFSSQPTPTSGDIFISGDDVRASAVSPQYADTRSPSKNGSSSLGRAGGAALHPGLPPRGQTTSSVPKVATVNPPDSSNGPSSANAAAFNTMTIPLRSGPPTGPPPPVPKKEGAESDIKEGRRGAQHFGNSSLYAAGYPANGTTQY